MEDFTELVNTRSSRFFILCKLVESNRGAVTCINGEIRRIKQAKFLFFFSSRQRLRGFTAISKLRFLKRKRKRIKERPYSIYNGETARARQMETVIKIPVTIN